MVAPAATVRALTCPSCGAAIALRAGELTQTVACASCHAVLDAKDPSLRVLQTYNEKMTFTPLIPLGTRGQIKGEAYEIIGFQVRSIAEDDVEYFWSEYLLWNPYKGFRYLVEYDGHWNDTVALRNPPEEEQASGQQGIVEHLGETFRQFQTAEARTRFIIGEFPWEVRIGDKATVSDYVNPPHVLSKEVTKDETTWSIGTYVQPETIWSAFKMPGAPPKPQGTYENQPDPYSGRAAEIWRLFAIFAAILLAVLVVREVTASRKLVYDGAHRFDRAAADTAPWVSPPFDIAGHTSNVAVDIQTNLANNWAYFSLALINDANGTAYDFGREVSYYSGYDSDGSWSEGSTSDRAFLPAVPPGRYYLRVQVENDTHLPFVYSIRLRRDVPRAGFYLIGLLLLAIAPALAAFRYWSFERARWQESDYAPAEGGE